MYTSIPSLLDLPPTPPPHYLLGHHRAPSWAPCAIQPLPTSYLFCTWQYIYNYVNGTLSNCHTLSLPILCPQVCSLYLCFYSCPANSFISNWGPSSELDFGAWDYARDMTVSAKLLQSCSTLCDPIDCMAPGSSVLGILQARKNTGVDCYWLLQGIFLTQGANPRLLGLLHWQAGSLPLASPGKPRDTTVNKCCVCLLHLMS